MTYEQLCEMDPGKDVEGWLQAVSVLLDLQEAQAMAASALDTTKQ